MKLIILVLSLLFFSCAASEPTADEIAKADYGSYPSDYKEIVNKWIFFSFYDPGSVQGLVITEPKKDHFIVESSPLDSKLIYGFSIGVGLNAKNRFGGYVGYKFYYILIRNGEIAYKMEISRPN